MGLITGQERDRVMGKSSRRVDSQLRAEIEEALKAWLSSLPANEVRSKCLYALGEEYSPLEIVHAVEDHTDFGKEFIDALYALHRRMKKKNPNSSVTDLIRRSI